MTHAQAVAGFHQQMEAYCEAALEGREEFHGALAGGDWNHTLEPSGPVTKPMGEVGMRLIAQAHIDGLFASGRFRCVELVILRPPRPADHPWLLVDVSFEGHVFRVLIANTHVGLAIPQLLRDAKRKHKPDMVLVQEAGRFVSRLALRVVFPKTNWAAAGFWPPFTTRMQSSGTMVLARRRVFKKRGAGNPLVSKGFDSMHPARRCTWMDVRHRRAGLSFRAISAHTWVHGG